jgi:hypothetical protein
VVHSNVWGLRLLNETWDARNHPYIAKQMPLRACCHWIVRKVCGSTALVVLSRSLPQTALDWGMVEPPCSFQYVATPGHLTTFGLERASWYLGTTRMHESVGYIGGIGMVVGLSSVSNHCLVSRKPILGMNGIVREGLRY